MKKTFILLLSCALNLCIGQTHTFQREVQNVIFSFQVFKNPFDSSLYTWKQIEYSGMANELDMAKTDTAGNIISNIAFLNTDYDNTYRVIPFSNGFIGGGSEYQGSNESNMVRFDYSGNIIWAKRYAAVNGFRSRPFIVDEANNIILSIAAPVTVTVNNYPVYILKTDLSGNVISVHGYRDLSTTGYSLVPVDLIKLNSGNYLFVTSVSINAILFRQVLLELDPALNIVSSKRISTSQGDPAYSIKYIKKPGGGSYIIGNFPNTFPNYYTHGFIINLSPTFNQFWANYTSNTAGPYGLEFTDGKLTPDGGLMIGGTYTSPAGDDDMMLMKVDSTGNLNWAKAIGNSGNDERLKSFVYEPNDAIYLAGNRHDTTQSSNNINALFLKTDLTGNTSCGSASLPLSLNTMNVTLYNEPFTTTSLTVTVSVPATGPIPGFTFIPVCDGVVSGIEKNEPSFSDVNIFPNPADYEFQISDYNFQKGDEIIFSDISGKICFTKRIQSLTSDLRLQTSGLNNGIYFLEVKTKKVVLNKKVVVHH